MVPAQHWVVLAQLWVCQAQQWVDMAQLWHWVYCPAELGRYGPFFTGYLAQLGGTGPALGGSAQLWVYQAQQWVDMAQLWHRVYWPRFRAGMAHSYEPHRGPASDNGGIGDPTTANLRSRIL